MPDIEIAIPEDQLAHIESLFEGFPRDYRRVVANAMNRASRTMKTQIVRKAAKALGIKQKIIRKRVWFQRATPDRLASQLRAGVVGFRLIDLGARELKGGGVKVRKQKYAQAFIATMPGTGHTGVFMRKGLMLALGMVHAYDYTGVPVLESTTAQGITAGARLPIRELRSASITKAVRGIATLPAILQKGRETLDKRLLAETERMLKRRGRAEWLTPLTSRSPN